MIACEHGSLRRSCEICHLEADLRELLSRYDEEVKISISKNAEINALKAENATLMEVYNAAKAYILIAHYSCPEEKALARAVDKVGK